MARWYGLCKPDGDVFPRGDYGPGISKREYFALHLMAAVVSNQGTFIDAAEASVKAADHLIAALNKETE